MIKLDKTDKRMFEYINHLHFGKVDHKDLTWEEHSLRPASSWVFPEMLETYFEKVFVANKDIIANKKILDVGCEYGTKIPWFDKMSPLEMTCIEPNTAHSYIASYVAGLAETKVTCVNVKAEDYPLTADTIFLLSVNHHLDNEFEVYKNLDCDHFVLDTWTDRNSSFAEINNFFEGRKYILENEFHFKENRVIARFKKNV